MADDTTNEGMAFAIPSPKKILERFYFHKYNSKTVNQVETHITAFAEALVKDKTTRSISEIMGLISNEYNRYTDRNRKAGTGGLTPLRISGTVAGSPELVTREFSFIARGRKTQTFTIGESLFKNCENGYQVAIFNLNKIEYEK